MDFNEIRYNELIEDAEKNLSYNNDIAYETALKFFKQASDLKPDNIELIKKINWLDKFINYKNYKYQNEETEIVKFAEIIIDCINVKEFERLYNLISDDFVFIGEYLGKSKSSFIDSVYWLRKGFSGLYADLRFYIKDDKKIPCICFNNSGVLFLNIDDNKIVRIFHYEIGKQINPDKLIKQKQR